MTDDHVAKTVTVYDRIAEEYAVSMNAYAPEVERKKFLKHLNEGKVVLDAGCAAGRDSIYFAQHGKNIIGIDLSKKLLEIARKSAPNIEFINKDIRKLDFCQNTFDGIWACAVLLHLKREEAQEVVKKFYEIQKPGGILFIMVKLGIGETDIAEKLSSDTTRHFTLFEKEEIERFIKSAGYIILESYVWNSKDRYKPERDVEWISVFARKKIKEQV
ncbi:class I SAM-dependent methyltransferase [Patescibacteria group bacterium]